jgi:hypothetical protein
MTRMGLLVISLMLSMSASAATLEQIVDRTVGSYNTAAQVAKGTGTPRHAFATRVAMPNVGPHTLYMEWRNPDANGPVTSQRIWSFREAGDHVEMRYYTLNPSADRVLRGVHKAGDGDEAAIAALTVADLNGYPDNCHFILRIVGGDLTGKNGTGDCVIFNRREKSNMRPDVLLNFQPDRFVEDGTFAYEVTGKVDRIVQEFGRIK